MDHALFDENRIEVEEFVWKIDCSKVLSSGFGLLEY